MVSKTYGLLADVHANDVALKIALEQLEQQGVEEIICAGDIVGYGGCPNETISLLKKYNVKCILGNHDFYLLALLKGDLFFNQFVFLPELLEQSTTMKFRDIAVLMFEYQKKIITQSSTKWLSALPISLISDESNIFAVHGAPPVTNNHSKIIEFEHYPYVLNKYLFPWLQTDLSVSCHVQPTETMVVGHTHMQFAHQSKNSSLVPEKTAHPCLMKYELFPIRKTFTRSYPLLINPGSVGQSRDEIDAPGYATIRFQGKYKRIVTWYRYTYDFESFVNKMKGKHAPEEIFDRSFWHV